MTLRAVAFIDGNNLHYQLGEQQLQVYLVNFAPGSLAQSLFTAGRLRILADSVRVFSEAEVKERYLSAKLPPPPPRRFVRPAPRPTTITPWEPPPEPPNGV